MRFTQSIFTITAFSLITSLSACSSLTSVESVAPESASLTELLQPVTQTGQFTIEADASAPIISVMGFIVKKEKELKITPEQAKVLADFRKRAKPQRIALEKNIIALRVNLRQALMTKVNKAERDTIVTQLQATEQAILDLRSECMDLIAKELDDSQFKALMDMYEQSLK